MIKKGILCGILTYVAFIVAYVSFDDLVLYFNEGYLGEFFYCFYFSSNFFAGFVSGYISKSARIEIGLFIGIVGLLIFALIGGLASVMSSPKFLLITWIALAGLSSVYGATINTKKLSRD